MDNMKTVVTENYIITPEYNAAGRLCNYHTGGENEGTVTVPADEWDRFNQLAGRQHEVADGVVVYNADLPYAWPDGCEPVDPRAVKLAEIGAACSAAIYAGVDVDGGHYSLSEHDQIELMGQMAAVQAGAEAVPYHADGELCRLYTAAEFMAVAAAATAFIFYNRTYCNHVNAWVRRAAAEELGGICYGAELPEDLSVSLAGVLAGVEA